MGELLVDELDDAVIARLETRAALAGVTLEQLVHDLLVEAASPSRSEDGARAEFVPGADSSTAIRELGEHHSRAFDDFARGE